MTGLPSLRLSSLTCICRSPDGCHCASQGIGLAGDASASIPFQMSVHHDTSTSNSDSASPSPSASPSSASETPQCHPQSRPQTARDMALPHSPITEWLAVRVGLLCDRPRPPTPVWPSATVSAPPDGTAAERPPAATPSYTLCCRRLGLPGAQCVAYELVARGGSVRVRALVSIWHTVVAAVASPQFCEAFEEVCER